MRSHMVYSQFVAGYPAVAVAGPGAVNEPLALARLPIVFALAERDVNVYRGARAGVHVRSQGRAGIGLPAAGHSQQGEGE